MRRHAQELTPSRRRGQAATMACAVAVCAALLASSACFQHSTLPSALGDQELWTLIETLSEPAGTFPLSDNLVSNEPYFADAVKRLRPAKGVYIGVGPEQNFSYIVGLRPAMAFIVDIRRENLALHLFYKALFELSTDRADFVSRLFSSPRPPGLQSSSTIEEIFAAYDLIAPSQDLFDRNAALIRERLVTTHRLPLTQADLEWIAYAHKRFFTYGPNIDYYYGARAVDAVKPSYRQLMTAKDFMGQSRSFLASDSAFRLVQDLETKNLIVPVVGDFAGPTTFRRIGDYVRQHGDRVQAVYASNVAVYLNSREAALFCGNLIGLPRVLRTWFIDSAGARLLDTKIKACAGVEPSTRPSGD